MKFDPVEPIKKVHVRSSYFLCGLCGRIVARNRPFCKNCGVELDWSRLENNEKVGVLGDEKRTGIGRV